MPSMLLVLLLSACDATGSAGGSVVTPDPVVRPSVAPVTAQPRVGVPSFVSVGAQGIDVADAEQRVLDLVPYSTPATEAVTRLSALLGEPVHDTLPGDGTCTPDRDRYTWGALELLDPAGLASPAGTAFSIDATGAQTSGGLPIVAAFGHGAGESASQVLALVPQLQLVGATDLGRIVMEAGTTDPAQDPWGTVADVHGDRITDLLAPVYVYGEC